MTKTQEKRLSARLAELTPTPCLILMRSPWLGSQPQNARAVAALEQLLHSDTDPRLRRAAHRALKRQDPYYKAAVDAQARERGMVAARTGKGQRDVPANAPL